MEIKSSVIFIKLQFFFLECFTMLKKQQQLCFVMSSCFTVLHLVLDTAEVTKLTQFYSEAKGQVLLTFF